MLFHHFSPSLSTHTHTHTHTCIHTYTQTLRLKNSLPLCFQNLNFPVICILSLNNFSFSIYHLCFDSGIFIYFCSFSATKSCWTLCDPMNCNTLGSSILQYLPEFAHIHILWVIASPWRGRGETSALLLTNRLCWKQWDISPVITFHEPVMFLLAGFFLWALKPAATLCTAVWKPTWHRNKCRLTLTASKELSLQPNSPCGTESCR